MATDSEKIEVIKKKNKKMNSLLDELDCVQSITALKYHIHIDEGTTGGGMPIRYFLRLSSDGKMLKYGSAGSLASYLRLRAVKNDAVYGIELIKTKE